MAIVFADLPNAQNGIYGTSTGLFLGDGTWTGTEGASGSTNLLSDPSGVGGIVLRTIQSVQSSVWWGIYKTIPTSAATYGLSVRLWSNSLPYKSSRSNPMCGFGIDGTDQNKLLLRVMPDGSLQLLWGRYGDITGDNAVQIARSDPCITANAFSHIEMKATIGAGSTGACVVKVDGVEVINVTGQDFGSTNFGRVWLASAKGAGSSGEPNTIAYWKECIVWDTTGSIANDFLGPGVTVRDLLPNGDHDLQWTPSTGSTGYDLVDDDPSSGSPDDADYISAASSAVAANIFDMEASPSVNSCYALMSISRQEKSDASAATVQVSLSPNGTNWSTGTDNALSESFLYYYDIHETSPATASAWTESEISSLELRADRTS